MHPDEERRLGDQSQAASHFPCTDRTGDPVAVGGYSTSPEVKGQKGNDASSKYAAEAARQGRTHGLGVEWGYADIDCPANPYHKKMLGMGILPPERSVASGPSGRDWYSELPDESDIEDPLLAKAHKGGVLQRFNPKLAAAMDRKLNPSPPRPMLPVNAVGAGRARSYALHGLSKELRILAYTPEGSRNDQLNRTGFKVARFVRDGVLSYEEVVGPLRDTAAAIGLPDREIEATIRSAFNGADAKDLHTEIPDRSNDLPSAYQIGGDEQ